MILSEAIYHFDDLVERFDLKYLFGFAILFIFFFLIENEYPETSDIFYGVKFIKSIDSNLALISKS